MGPLGFLRAAGQCLRPYRGRVAALAPILAIQAAFFLFVPISFKLIFDEGIGNSNVEFLGAIVVVSAIGFVVTTGADLLQGYLTAGLGIQVMNDIRTGMFRHLQRLGLGFFAQVQTGDLLSRFTNDLNAIDRAVTRALYKIALNAAVIGLCLAALFYLEWRLALATVLAMPLTALGPQVFTGRATREAVQRKEDEARVTTVVQESIGAQKVVRAFGLEGAYLDRFEGEQRVLRRSGVRANLFSAYVERTSVLGILLVQLLVVGLGALLAIHGYLTGGTVVGFVGLLINVGDGVANLTSAIPELIQATSGMQRIQDFMGEEPQVEDGEGARATPRLAEAIRLDHVSFSYTGQRRDLDDVNLTIEAGQSVAFVGRSGSGKSTVLNLICRFYDVADGAVRFDGVDVRAYTQASLRSQMGAVFQETFLADGTIRENIRQGCPEATDAQVEAAARDAEIHDLILSWPAGYDTPVGEGGGRLSGGQRQRIALARALIRDPAILVLDEATSALDPSTEAAINATLERLSKDRTVIAVTHRLNSVVNADRLFVLDEGRVVEQGSHKELLNEKGIYHEMWQEFALELTQEALVGDVEGDEIAAADEVVEADTDLLERVRTLQSRMHQQGQELVRQQAINQRWAQLAGTDRLTGLPNKLAFVQAIVPQEIQQARHDDAAIGFILISGDNVGLINERYGRAAGDQVIGEMSRLLQSVLKGEEQLGHIDGTHFSVVSHPAPLEATAARAEEIRRVVEAHRFAGADDGIETTVSAGITSVDSAAVTDTRAAAEAAYEDLSRALYAAKKAGGNRIEAAAPATSPG